MNWQAKKSKSTMKRSTKGSIVLSDCLIQAVRLNQLESSRLQRNVHLMHADLQEHLARLERDAKDLRDHYKHVVQNVQSNRAFQFWKETHPYEIAREEKKSIKLKQRATSRARTKLPLLNPVPCKTVHPLVLILDEKVAEPLVDQTKNLLRPTTSPVKTHTKPSIRILDEHPTNSKKTIVMQRPDAHVASHLPPIAPSHSRKKPKTSHLDVSYQLTLHNRTLKEPLRPVGLVK